MGACSFQTETYKGSMIEAYRSAVDDAVMERGHDPYNGSVSTTDGVVQAVHSPMTQKGASLYAGQEAENCRKWGSARAIPVAGDEHFTFTKVKLTVTLPPTQAVLDWDGKPTGRTAQTSEWDLHEAAFKQVFAKYQVHMIHDVNIVPKMKVKTVVDAPQGKSVTRYEVPSWGQSKLYPTKAAAVRAAREQLGSNTSQHVTVRAVRYWPESDTTNAATVRNETVAATAEVTVTLAHAKKASTPIAAWVFYGMAAE